MWASELKQRWDMLWTCSQCWEARHPSDFYRNRSDVHQLPFIRPDSETEITFAAQGGGIVITTNVGDEQTTTPLGTYSVNALTGKTKFTQVAFTFTRVNTGLGSGTGATVDRPQSTVRSSGGIWNLPTTPGGSGVVGTAVWFNSNGVFLGQKNITGGVATVTGPIWNARSGHVTFSGTYTT